MIRSLSSQCIMCYSGAQSINKQSCSYQQIGGPDCVEQLLLHLVHNQALNVGQTLLQRWQPYC